MNTRVKEHLTQRAQSFSQRNAEEGFPLRTFANASASSAFKLLTEF